MSKNNVAGTRARPLTIDATLMKPASDGLWHAVAPPARRGFWLLCIFVGGFGLWSFLAPLDGGAVAPGVVGPDTNRKTVQHLEGGIIAKLKVKEGDVVDANQPLVELESLQPRATHDILQQDYRTQIATRIRLEAEKAVATKLEFPPELNANADPAMRRILDDQQGLFSSRLAFHQARFHVLTQRKTQLAEQIRGFRAQIESAKTQTELIDDELEGKQSLYDKRMIPKPELRKLERAKAEIIGKRGEYVAAVARAEEQIGEAELQLVALQAERMEQIASQLDQVRTKLAEVDQKLQASRDVLDRTIVRAPVAGTVLNLKFKTEGGVVMRGEPIMDIVPLNDTLLIDARIAPNDIDVVRNGLRALVHLTAYSSRGTPKVHGVVKSVSADRVIDENSKQPYFLARVAVDRAEIDRLTPKVELSPGMPAEALIVTERRTLMRYLMQPFLDAWRRSFREV
jgi:HlyD family secretion protein